MSTTRFPIVSISFGAPTGQRPVAGSPELCRGQSPAEKVRPLKCSTRNGMCDFLVSLEHNTQHTCTALRQLFQTFSFSFLLLFSFFFAFFSDDDVVKADGAFCKRQLLLLRTHDWLDYEALIGTGFFVARVSDEPSVMSGPN